MTHRNPAAPKLRPSDIARALHLYEAENWCISAIADHLEVTRSAITYHLRKQGVRPIAPSKIAR
jgi:DNA-binding MarR family transcriptional regulator